MRDHLRSGKPCCNSLQDFDISDKCIIKARGVDNDDTIILEAWKPLTWVHDDWFEVCSARSQHMTDCHPGFSEKVVYELFPL